MAIIKCPECGHQVSDKAATCPSCGIEIAGRVMKCPECGSIVFKEQELCPNCHYTLHGEPVAEQPSNHNDDVATEPAKPTPTVNQPTTESTTPPADQPEKEKKGGNKALKATIIGVVILLIVAFVAIYFYKSNQQRGEADAYAEAMLSDQPAVLQNYLDIYTDAPQEHRDSIEAHLTLLMNADKEWTDVVVSGSKAAIERYLQMHPNSPHQAEAKIKIDSLDWVAASTANTTEALQSYLDNHPDGLYYDEAHSRFDKLDAQQVTATDCELVSTLFGNFFRALAANDGDALTANVENVMTTFLTKKNATKNDLIKYMNSVHQKAGDSPIEYRMNNDWKITKSPAADGTGTEYTVTFTVDEKIAKAGEEQAKLISTIVDATIAADGKISSMKMKSMKEE